MRQSVRIKPVDNMKTLFKLSAKTAFCKKTTLVVIIGIALAVAMMTIVLAMWQALVGFEDLIVYDIFASKGDYTVSQVEELVRSYPPRVQICYIAVIFSIITLAAAAIIIYGALHAKKRDVIKTASILSSLGIKSSWRSVFLLAQVLLPFCVAFPFGLIAGLLSSKAMVDKFNRMVCALMGLDNLMLFDGQCLLFIVLILVCCLTAALISGAAFAKHISKCAPIETVKAYGKINVSLKETRLDKQLQKRYSLCAKLAKANYYNNKAKYRVLSIIVSFAALVCTSLSLLKGYLTQYGMSSSVNKTITDNFISQFVDFAIIVLFISLFAACCCFCADFHERGKELAVLKSLGADKHIIRKSLCLEVLYHAVNAASYISVINILACVAFFLLFMSMNKYATFIIPLLEWIVLISVTGLIDVTLAVFMCASADKLDIINHIKSLL